MNQRDSRNEQGERSGDANQPSPDSGRQQSRGPSNQGRRYMPQGGDEQYDRQWPDRNGFDQGSPENESQQNGGQLYTGSLSNNPTQPPRDYGQPNNYGDQGEYEQHHNQPQHSVLQSGSYPPNDSGSKSSWGRAAGLRSGEQAGQGRSSNKDSFHHYHENEGPAYGRYEQDDYGNQANSGRKQYDEQRSVGGQGNSGGGYSRSELGGTGSYDEWQRGSRPIGNSNLTAGSPSPQQQQHQQRQHEYFDSDYHQWRSEQIRRLDENYRTWRQDRYKKFSDEFDTWRSKRSSGDNQANGNLSAENESPAPVHRQMKPEAQD